MAAPLSEEDLHSLYLWVDDLPLSRPKRNISRDFADGVCVAEIMKHFFPTIVELHNFTPANASKGKMDNWNTLNAKVFRKLHFEVTHEEIKDIVGAVPGAIERFLKGLQTKINQIKQRQQTNGSSAHHQQQYSSRSAASYRPGSVGQRQGPTVDQLLAEKDQTIQELRESMVILTEKVRTLEEIIKNKDSKIAVYEQRLAGGNVQRR